MLKMVWLLCGLAPLVALIGCVSATKAPEQQGSIDPFGLEIEAGRWGVMNLQGEELLQAARDAAIAGDETDEGRRLAVATQLRQEVFALARLKAGACPIGRLSVQVCASNYAPVWLWHKDSMTPSWPTLQKRSDEVGAAVMPVWDELCSAAKAKAAPGSDDMMEICPME